MDARREVPLTTDELRTVTAYGIECARTVLEHFTAAHPEDLRPLEALTAAEAFAQGGPRRAVLRAAGWAAHRAARDAGPTAAGEAARSTMSAAAAAFLHPLAQAHQVKHILGAAAHAARAVELAAGDSHRAGEDHLARLRARSGAGVRGVLLRYPAAPPGGGRVGELLRDLDAALREEA
ncbi:exonuclease SbcC [Isoptericola sp. S6320L]|uniref:putative immunity protein n=1 Tax=Isoptericola sp. S6320L TaxID=2926411 RepID=UPI001FF1B443|nr:exonuclease SbcC [Isoptericola sp. S6320L]MCK0117986.1 exonuclease SbcC [Isoptericola sp. S6320L]